MKRKVQKSVENHALKELQEGFLNYENPTENEKKIRAVHAYQKAIESAVCTIAICRTDAEKDFQRAVIQYLHDWVQQQT